MKKLLHHHFKFLMETEKGRLMEAEKLNRIHKNATKPDMQLLEFKLEF